MLWQWQDSKPCHFCHQPSAFTNWASYPPPGLTRTDFEPPISQSGRRTLNSFGRPVCSMDWKLYNNDSVGVGGWRWVAGEWAEVSVTHIPSVPTLLAHRSWVTDPLELVNYWHQSPTWPRSPPRQQERFADSKWNRTSPTTYPQTWLWFVLHCGHSQCDLGFV